MKNLSDGEIWIKELKETQKGLKKMYVDKNDKNDMLSLFTEKERKCSASCSKSD